MDDATEREALRRIRILRRDSYRCRFATDSSRPCGAPASMIGTRPVDDEVVALCLRHSLPR